MKTINKEKQNRGFTIVELMVSLAVIMIVMAVILFDHGKFKNDLSITNLAYEVALTIRQAQSYGTGVRVNNTDSSKAYGIKFVKSNDLTSENSYMMYYDFDNTGFSGSSVVGGSTSCPSDAVDCIEVFKMNKGVVADICEIASTSLICGKNSVDITFLRPNPDARFIFDGSGILPNSVGGVQLCLESPDGIIKKVKIYAVGQISVDSSSNTSCAN